MRKTSRLIVTAILAMAFGVAGGVGVAEANPSMTSGLQAEAAKAPEVATGDSDCIPDNDPKYTELRAALATLQPSADAPSESIARVTCRPDLFGQSVTSETKEQGSDLDISGSAIRSSGTFSAAAAKCWTRKGPRSITIQLSSVGINVGSFKTAAWGCLQGQGKDVTGADGQCSGKVTKSGSALGVSYSGQLDDSYKEYYTYGKRKHGGYHVFCKAKFDLGPILRSIYPAGSVWLHADGSTEVKQHDTT